MRSKITLALASLALLALGCDRDDRQDIAATARNLVEDVKLQGTYETQCMASDLLDFSHRISLTLRGNQLKQTQNFYAEDDCTQDAIGAIQYEGEFTVDETKDENGNDIDTIDVTLEKVEIHPASEEIVTALNTANFCGRNDYAVGQTVNVSTSSGDVLCVVKDVPEELYGTYALDNGNLYFGEGTILDMSTDPTDRELNIERKTELAYKK